MSYDGPEKKEVKTKKVFPTVPCTEKNFETDYEKKFWTLNTKSNLLCVLDKNNQIYM